MKDEPGVGDGPIINVRKPVLPRPGSSSRANDTPPDGRKGAAITTERDGERLRWREDPPVDEAAADTEGLRWPLRSTLSLHLAVAGWPLVRGSAEWADRHRWSDLGMPEGLAYKITLFEAHARRHGFRVETPRTPGFRVPTNRETLSGGAQHRRSDRNAI